MRLVEWGCGRVFRRVDGVVKPCGGPFKCGSCMCDQALLWAYRASAARRRAAAEKAAREGEAK